MIWWIIGGLCAMYGVVLVICLRELAAWHGLLKDIASGKYRDRLLP